MSEKSFPLVDVVMPTNRSAEFLRTTIASVVSQTYPAWRLHIVDNGSPAPESLRAAVEAAAPTAASRGRISVERIAARGVSAARNHGVRIGTGEYIAFLDDDDIWAPTFLERMVDALESHPHTVAAHSAGRYLTSDGEPFGLWTAPAVSSAQMLSGDHPFPRIIALLVRRSVWDDVGWFDERYAYSEDMDMTCRLLMSGELVAVPEPLAFYRIHPTSVSRSPDANRQNWMSFERFFGDRITQVRAAGNRTLARQLTRNRRRARLHAAEMSAHSVLVALSTRTELTEARRTTGWALRHAPLAFIGSSAKRLVAHGAGRLRSRRPRQPA